MAATADQVALSAVNLVVSLILLNTVPKLSYGYYSIAYAIILFTVAVQNAIIGAPLAVQLVSKQGRARSDYVGSLLYGQFLVTVPLSVAGLIALTVLLSGETGYWRAAILSAMACGLTGILFREFLRSYFFAQERPGRVLKMDALYILLILGLLALYHALAGLTVAGVFILTGAASLMVAALFGGLTGFRRGFAKVRDSFAENWLIGRWALLGVIVTHIQSYSYLYITAGVLGGTVVADLAAAKLLISPLMLFKAAWSKTAIPRGARMRDEKRMKQFFHELILVNFLFLIGALAYLYLLNLSAGVLLSTLLPSKYAGVFHYTAIWGAVSLMGFVLNNASCGLQVIKAFKTITNASFFAMLLTVGLCYFLALQRGGEGVLFALLIGDAVLACVLWGILWRRLSREHFTQSSNPRSRS